MTSKQTSRRHAAENFKSLLANPVAVQLGLDEPNGPPALLAQTREALAERGISDERDMMYMYLLDACEKVFDNELDQATFEEHMRWFFGTKASAVPCSIIGLRLRLICVNFEHSGISRFHAGQGHHGDHQTGEADL